MAIKTGHIYAFCMLLYYTKIKSVLAEETYHHINTTELSFDTSIIPMFLYDLVSQFEIDYLIIVVHDTDTKRFANILKALWIYSCQIQLIVLNSGQVTLPHLSSSKIGYVLLMDNSHVYMDTFSDQGYLDTDAQWFVKVDSYFIPTNSSHLKLRLNSRVYRFNFLKEDVLAITEVYKVSTDAQLTISPIGLWNINYGFVLTDLPIWERRQNLSELTLQVTTGSDPPFQILDKHTSKITGLVGDIWNIIQRKLGFKYQTRPIIDGLWGSKLDNGSFSGMIGMLNHQEIDVAVAAFILTKSRAEGAQFLTPFTSSVVQAWIKKTKNVDGSQTYVRPFTPLLLLVTILGFCFSSLIMTFINYQRRKFFKDQYFNFKMSLMTVIHGAMGQGTPMEPESASNKILFWMMFATGFLLCAAYSACLASLLAIKKPHLPFNDFQSFYHNSNYMFLSINGMSFVEHIKNGNGIEQMIYENRMVLKSSWDELKEEFHQKENRMLVWNSEVLGDLTTDFCSLVSIPRLQYKSKLGLMVQLNSPYAEMLNYHIKKLLQSGHYSYIENRYVTKLESVSCNDINVSQGLGMDDVFTLFVFYGVAIILAIIFLLLEILFTICPFKMSNYV